jgi:aryl-alcohol dehydrogenase-like predicted oxidoreductase
VNARGFLTATIAGATHLEQLAANIAGIGIELPPAVLEGIEAIHREHPNP